MLRTRTLMLGALIVCALSTVPVSAQPTSKRFDRFSFLNCSLSPVDGVHVDLLDQNGDPWGTYDIGTLDPGASQELIVDQEIPGTWVTRIVCSSSAGGNVIEVGPEESLVEATFTFAVTVEGEGLTGDGIIVPGCPQ